MSSPLRAYLLLVIVWSFQLIISQHIPENGCPQYFEYLRYGDQILGKITLNVSPGSTRINVRFSQRVPLQSNYYGRLSLYQDQQTTVNNIENGYPISYRVEFPTPNVVPKITRINVNDVDICLSDEYPLPSTVLNLQHSLQTATTTIRRPRPPVNNFIPEASASTYPTVTRPNQFQIPGFSSNPFLQGNQGLQPLPPVTSAPALDVRTQTNTRTPSVTAVCGRPGTTSLTPFIHGGTVLSRGQFPWLTAIYKKQSAGLKFLCGGSLISASTVLTAAHCFKLIGLTADKIVVFLGRHDLENYGETGAMTRDIRDLIINPEYNSNSFPDADLAILHLQTPVGFSQFILPICLWSESDDASLIVGQTAYIAGWGADENGLAVTALPKMVDASIVSDADCLRSLDAYKALTSRRTFCAGNRDGTGPCMGDSGGGLMLNRNGRWMLRGVVSAGQTVQQQCNLREYVIYCDVAKHISWVRSNVL